MVYISRPDVPNVFAFVDFSDFSRAKNKRTADLMWLLLQYKQVKTKHKLQDYALWNDKATPSK
jgi:hypothetical protein